MLYVQIDAEPSPAQHNADPVQAGEHQRRNRRDKWSTVEHQAAHAKVGTVRRPLPQQEDGDGEHGSSAAERMPRRQLLTTTSAGRVAPRSGSRKAVPNAVATDTAFTIGSTFFAVSPNTR